MDNPTAAHIPLDLVEQLGVAHAEQYTGDWTAREQRHDTLARLYGQLADQVQGDAAQTIWRMAYAAQSYHEDRANFCRDRVRDEAEETGK